MTTANCSAVSKREQAKWESNILYYPVTDSIQNKREEEPRGPHNSAPGFHTAELEPQH